MIRNRLVLLLLATSINLTVFVLPVQAAIQDTDIDSLTDDSEMSLYGTDPALFDTDGDGIGDGEEILDSTNPLDPTSSHILTFQTTDPGILGETTKRPWYFGRASGIAAFILFTLVVIHGLIMTSRVWGRVFSLATIYTIHEYLGLSALALAVLHTIGFFFDEYLRISFSEALVPFLLDRPLRSAQGVDIGIAVAVGIIALYLAVVIALTALYRHKLPPKLWRVIHYLGFLFYVLIVVHGLAAGSDAWNPWMRGLYLASLIIVGMLISLRIVAARWLKRIATGRFTPASTHPSTESDTLR